MKLTQSDVEKIKEEIEHRKLVVRPEAIEAVKEARAQGDLSENFEYYAAKKDKNKNEGRIRYLERVLKTATIISDESADDEVGLNNTVQVYFNRKHKSNRCNHIEILLHTVISVFSSASSLFVIFLTFYGKKNAVLSSTPVLFPLSASGQSSYPAAVPQGLP